MIYRFLINILTSFVILAKTTVSLPIGNYNIYWTTSVAYTGTTSTVSNGRYGIILSNTVPTAFSGSSYTQVFSQAATSGQNNLYTSSAYISPATADLSVYLCIIATFATVVITPNSLTNLQVIRCS